MNAIASAIENAKNAAAQVVAAPAATNLSVVKPGPALTASDMMTGEMNADTWLKVNAYGLFIGKDRTPFQTLKLGLDMSEVSYSYAIKFGNPAQYLKTHDHLTCVQGGSWSDAISRAMSHDPRAREYRSADLPFQVLEPIKTPAGAVIADVGVTIGHGLSTTGWRSFSSFLKQLEDDGHDKETVRVIITLGFKPMKNSSGEWGVLDFSKYELAGE